jgi:hypothetical protein
MVVEYRCASVCLDAPIGFGWIEPLLLDEPSAELIKCKRLEGLRVAAVVAILARALEPNRSGIDRLLAFIDQLDEGAVNRRRVLLLAARSGFRVRRRGREPERDALLCRQQCQPNG